MGESSRRQMNEMLTALQVKGDVFMKQLMLEKKRVKDLDDALKQATAQVWVTRSSDSYCCDGSVGKCGEYVDLTWRSAAAFFVLYY